MTSPEQLQQLAVMVLGKQKKPKNKLLSVLYIALSIDSLRVVSSLVVLEVINIDRRNSEVTYNSYDLHPSRICSSTVSAIGVVV